MEFTKDFIFATAVTMVALAFLIGLGSFALWTLPSVVAFRFAISFAVLVGIWFAFDERSKK